MSLATRTRQADNSYFPTGRPECLRGSGLDVKNRFEKFVPRLAKKGFGKAELNKVLVENPRRILAF